MSDLLPVVFGAAIALVLAVAWLAIDWERIHSRIRRKRRRGFIYPPGGNR